MDELLMEGARARIEEAIHLAEKNTSGEIRVHLDDFCPEAVMDRAAFLFAELDMHRTELRNGILIYVALEDKKLAILGDAGIHAKVGDAYWEKTLATMRNSFRSGNWIEGICDGVAQVGEQLKTYFPFATSDQNELPNTLTSERRASAQP